MGREPRRRPCGSRRGCPLPRATSLVQIQRTVHAEPLPRRTPRPGGRPFDIAGGERSHLRAVPGRRSTPRAARSTSRPWRSGSRHRGQARGGARARRRCRCPHSGRPGGHVRLARRDPGRKAEFDQLGALGQYETLHARRDCGARPGWTVAAIIYVHAKIMLVDDAWATIGSCNLHAIRCSATRS